MEINDNCGSYLVSISCFNGRAPASSFDDDEKNLHRDFEGPDFKFCLFIPVSVKSTSNLLAEKKRFLNDSCRHKEMPFEAHSLI